MCIWNPASKLTLGPLGIYRDRALRFCACLHTNLRVMSLRDLLRVIGPGQKSLRNLTMEEAQKAFEAILSG